jgi:hypothetical protein
MFRTTPGTGGMFSGVNSLPLMKRWLSRIRDAGGLLWLRALAVKDWLGR